MTAEIPSCAKCGQPHVTRQGKQACAAHKKRGGGHCTQPPMNGGKVCRIHGGSAPQTKAAASRRLQQAAVQGEIGKLLAEYEDLDTGKPDPKAGILEVITRTRRMMAVYGDLVAGLDEANGTVEFVPPAGETRGHVVITRGAPSMIELDHNGDLKTHPFAIEYRSWSTEHARVCKLAIDAGVAEQQVQIAKQLADDEALRLKANVEAALEVLDLTPEQAALAPKVIAALLRSTSNG